MYFFGSLFKTQKKTTPFVSTSWGLDNIAKKVKATKNELEMDIELDKQDKENLNEVIFALQRLYTIAAAKCNENNIDQKECYIDWWIDY